MGNRLTRPQQEAMLRRSLEVLAEVSRRAGNIVWMSAEPLSWDVTSVVGSDHPLDWVVIGAASNGPREYQPAPAHVERLLRVLDVRPTAVFYKGNLRSLFRAHDNGDPGLNRWREDFPIRYRDGSEIAAVAERQKMCQKHGWTRVSLSVLSDCRELPLLQGSPTSARSDGEGGR